MIAEMAVEETVTYTRRRGSFGKTVFDFQSTGFKLVECMQTVACRKFMAVPTKT